MNSLTGARASSFFTGLFAIFLSLILIGQHGSYLADAQGISDSEFCNQPADPGFCYAYFPSYYYERNTGKCEEFVYGGCGGNLNRFDNIRQCEKAKKACHRRRN